MSERLLSGRQIQSTQREMAMPIAVDSVQGVHSSASGSRNIDAAGMAQVASQAPSQPPPPPTAPAPAPAGPTIEELEARWDEIQRQINQAERNRDETMEESTVSTLLAMTFENMEMLEEGREPVDEYDQKAATPKMSMSQIMRMNASGAVRDLIAQGNQVTSLRAEQIQIEWQIKQIETSSSQPTS